MLTSQSQVGWVRRYVKSLSQRLGFHKATSLKQVTLGGQQVTLRPLTTGEFLELIYASSDILHDALVDWVTYGENTYSFVASLLSRLGKEDVTKFISIFLRREPEWLEENVTANEAFKALEEAARLNDWTEILQTLVILDTLKLDEIMQLWQMAKAGDSLKKS